MPKLRTRTLSGSKPTEAPSRARSHKPPAKELSKRKAAALASGGGRLPRRIREELDREPPARRARDLRSSKKPPTRTRAGKREGRGARWAQATELQDANPSRRAGNRAPDPGRRRDKVTQKLTHPR